MIETIYHYYNNLTHHLIRQYKFTLLSRLHHKLRHQYQVVITYSEEIKAWKRVHWTVTAELWADIDSSYLLFAISIISPVDSRQGRWYLVIIIMIALIARAIKSVLPYLYFLTSFRIYISPNSVFELLKRKIILIWYMFSFGLQETG